MRHDVWQTYGVLLSQVQRGFRGAARRPRVPEHVSCVQARRMPSSPLLPPPPQRTASKGRQTRCSLAEDWERTLSVLSHAERVDTQSCGGLAGRRLRSMPLVVLLTHTLSSTTLSVPDVLP